MVRLYISRLRLVLLSAFAFGLNASAPVPALASDNSPALIPAVQQIEMKAGQFHLNRQTKIFASDMVAKENAQLLSVAVQKILGVSLPVMLGKPTAQEQNFVQFLSIQTFAPSEAYNLVSDTKSLRITATAAGQFYALQTLLQLLPLHKQAVIDLPAMEINDTPRFAWRGMHLDVGRHMFSVDFIKKLLDQMAALKLNTFHWHLTEDQGWRIQIKQYPKLTQVGAWRKETTKDRHYEPYIGDGVPYGGFYTQEQIKEVVAYAQRLHIMVVPEIELPGHSQAALAAYPELACTPGPFAVATNWGVFEDIYCPTEPTFTFLENVLTEVMALFPAPYIHIGGDEAPKTRWKASAQAQAVMQREGLKNEEQLQSYFIRRVEKFINSKGKRLIGWDEILEGGLAPNATVMSWRGEEGGIAAAKEGHDVIMTPTSWCYFDAGQGPAEQELWQLGGEITLEKVYSYNPVPKVLDESQQSHIRGVQANIWTEYLPTSAHVEYMVFPRLLAMAEVAWTPQDRRNFADFEHRVQNYYPRLDQAKIAYRIPRPLGLDTPVQIGKEWQWTLTAPVKDSKMFYTLDGSEPSPSPKGKLYRKTLAVKKDAAAVLKVLTVLPDGRVSAVQVAGIPKPAAQASTQK